MNNNAQIETRTAFFYLDNDGLLCVKIKQDIIIDMEDAVDNHIVSRRVGLNEPRLMLIDARSNWQITTNAKKYFINDSVPERTIARAVVVKSNFDKLIIKFLLQLSKSNSELRIFTSVDEAKAWLMSIQK